MNRHFTRRQRSFAVEAVVLRSRDWGEADRLLWLYTLEMGKVRAVAKGVRRPRSRKAGHLLPFTQVRLLLAQGRDFFLVTQAEAINTFPSLRETIESATYASYVVELLDRFTFEEGENRPLYRLLVDTLERLASLAEREIVLRYYELRLLDLVGFRPQLFQCVLCKETIQAQDQFFSSSLGGVVCPSCGRLAQGVQPVSLPALKYLRHLQRSPFEEARRAHPTVAVQREMETLLQDYLRFHLERNLNTLPFLRRLRQEQSTTDF